MSMPQEKNLVHLLFSNHHRQSSGNPCRTQQYRVISNLWCFLPHAPFFTAQLTLLNKLNKNFFKKNRKKSFEYYKKHEWKIKVEF